MELLVGPALHDPAAVQDDDPVGVADGGEAVGDDEDGPARQELSQGALDEPLGLGVQVRRGLVQDQDRGVAQDGPGDADALALPAGQADAAVAEPRLHALRQLPDEVGGVGGPGGAPHLLVGPSVPVAVGDVRADGVVEDHRLLADDAHLAAERRQRVRPDVGAVDLDPAAVGVDEAGEEVHQRALPRPRRTHEGHHVALPDPQVHVPEHGTVVLVGEGHVVERHGLLQTLQLPGALRTRRLGLGVHDLEEAVGRGQRRLGPRRELGQRLHRRHEAEGQGDEGDELLRAQRRARAQDHGGPQPEEHQGHDGGEDLGEGRRQLGEGLRPDHPPGELVGAVLEAALLPLLPAVGLHQPDAAHRLLQDAHQLALPVVDLPEALPEPAEDGAEDRQEDRHEDHGQEGEPPGDGHHHRQVGHRRHAVAERLGQREAHDPLGLSRVGEDPRQELTRLLPGEEVQGEALEPGVDLVAHVPLDPLLHRHSDDAGPVEEEVLEEERREDHQADDAERLQLPDPLHPAAHRPVEHPLRHVLAGVREHLPLLEERAEERDQEGEAEGVEDGRRHHQQEADDEEPPVGPQVARQPEEGGRRLLRLRRVAGLPAGAATGGGRDAGGTAHGPVTPRASDAPGARCRPVTSG